jgi:hypothetical protein
MLTVDIVKESKSIKICDVEVLIADSAFANGICVDEERAKS